MRRAGFALVLLLVWAAVAGTTQRTAGGAVPPTLILVAFDGWRWDYDRQTPAPNLRSLAARGVRAENLIPAFPSKTFPNLYTIVTGLYPGHHGIVANTMRDPDTGRTFRMSTNEVRSPLWWGGEPIWVTAERQDRPTASMFWVGSEAPIGGVRPRYWKPYDEGYPPAARVDQVLGWLDLPPRDRPSLLTVYFSDVDSAGHADGPGSDAVRNAVRRADGYLGRLLRGLEQRGLADAVNVMVVSDHGMAAVDMRRVVVLDDYVALEGDEVIDLNPTVGLRPRPGREDTVFRALERAHPRLSVYRRAQTPEHWHYRDHPRVPTIVGVADEGWQVLRRSTVAAIAASRVRGAGGEHGYDPRVLSMRGIFVAAGPAFRQGVTVPAFENVHLYHVMARVLGLRPAANDGDPAVAATLLR